MAEVIMPIPIQSLDDLAGLKRKKKGLKASKSLSDSFKKALKKRRKKRQDNPMMLNRDA